MKKQYGEQIQNEVVGNVKSLGSSFKIPKINKKETDTKEPAVSDDVDIGEFKIRYSNLQKSCFISFILLIYSLYMSVTSSSLFGLVIALLCSGLFAMFYITQSYTCWRARMVASSWSNRSEPLSTTYNEFFDIIAKRPLELFATKLEFKE